MSCVQFLTCLSLCAAMTTGAEVSATEPTPSDRPRAVELEKTLDHQTARLHENPPIRFKKLFSIQATEGGGLKKLEFSPDGKTLAAGRWGGYAAADVTLWDLDTRKLLHVLPHATRMIGPIAFVPPGDRIVTAGTRLNKVFLWDTRSGKLLDTLDVGGAVDFAVTDLAAFPDGDRVICCAETGLIVWDLKAKTHTKLSLDEHIPLVGLGAGERPVTRYCHAVAFTADGSRFATTVNRPYLAPRILLWDAKTCRVVRIIPKGIGNSCLAYAPDGTTVAADEYAGARADSKGFPGRDVNVWNTAGGKEVLTGNPFDYSVNDLAYTRDGKYLLIAGRHDDADAEVETGQRPPGGGVQIGVWDVATGKLVNRVAPVASAPLRMAISPDNKLLAVPGRNIDIYAIEYAGK